MHIVLALLAAALIVYFVHRFIASRTPAGAAQDVGRTARGLAFLSHGQLFYREAGGDFTELESPYAREALERRERARQRHGWKQGTSFNIAAGGGMRNFEAPDAPILATCAAFESSGSLLYFLKDSTIGGLFRREAASGRELRLLLKPGLHLTDLSVSPDGALLAASSQASGGVANIVLCDREGNGLREVTGGDTVDSAPGWIPGVPGRLLFQSSGFARNEQGYIVAQGPASIQKLDMETGSVSPILDDPRFDFLRPRVSRDGHLHFIRRPYETPRYGAPNVLLDLLLFPFRLLRAVFHFLNFFSLMYSRKPLTSASGPAVQADLKNILLQGKRVDAEKALRSARPVHGVPSLVPESWELVRRSPQGEERVLARSVASFDLSSDGSVVYTNGHGVFAIEPDGSTRLALSGPVVSEVAASAA